MNDTFAPNGQDSGRPFGFGLPQTPPKAPQSRRVLVVGVCSSGKSTLVKNLKEKGYRAFACAQEHSGVPRLWERSNPDVLIYLDASIHAVRLRRKVHWKRAVLEQERLRLSHAREHCDLYIYTDGLSPEDVLSRALTFLWR